MELIQKQVDRLIRELSFSHKPKHLLIRQLVEFEEDVVLLRFTDFVAGV